MATPTDAPRSFCTAAPGSQAEAHYRQLFDPASYRLVMFDQRGAGRSAPSGSIEDNTTWHLVDDIEALRTHLGIDQWQVVGGSWGSTLGLCYAQTYPNSVQRDGAMEASGSPTA